MRHATTASEAHHEASRRRWQAAAAAAAATTTTTEERGAASAGLREAYRRVAAQDPSWFDAYVVRVLDGSSSTSHGDDDEALPILLEASVGADPEIGSQQQQHQQQEQQQVYVASPSVDDLMMELARLDGAFRSPRRRPGQRESDTAAIAAASIATSATESESVPSAGAPQQLATLSAATVDESIAAALDAEFTASSSMDGDSSLESRAGSYPEPRADADAAFGGAEEGSTESSAVSGPTFVAGPSSREKSADVAAREDGPVSTVGAGDQLPGGGDRLDVGTKSEIPQTTTSATTESADDRVVVYRDTSPLDRSGSVRQEEYLTVPFSELEALGYREADVASLRPEALDLIVKDRVPRPRSGVPERWKRPSPAASRDGRGRNDEDLVSIVEKTDVKAFLEGRRQRRPGTQSGASTKADLDSATPERRRRAFDQTNSSREEEPTFGRRDTRDAASRDKRGVDEPAERKSPEPRSRGEGRSRPIYSGRPARRDRRGAVALQDPPKPSAFWPDIDTFRDLLRNEASLRLRILGNDWAGVVKDESDWRLDLYTRWLWTLHNGVGEPIVESRSDRMRRMSYRNSASAPTAPGPRSVSSPSSKGRGSSGRERKRPNPETTL